uniref:Protein lin-37 homolog n=1 Tax=Triatoma infestans TaxID=30076 RepID=A0A023F855_TRIIF
MVKKKRINVSNKGKSRDRSPPSGDEIVSARDRFKGALQHLLPHSDEDSDSSEEDHWPPSKKRLSINKKKQQKSSEPEKPPEPDTTKFQQSFVMKLFDRSVDLAQFNENTPLYPICRAWIANQPHQVYNVSNNNAIKQSPPQNEEPYIIKEEKDFDPLKDVHVLPPPDTHLNGDYKVRVPEKITYQSKYNIIHQDGMEPPSRDKILKDNLIHWNNVRRSWLKASAKNELRYTNSIKVLSAMFNRAQRHFHCQ